MHKSLAPFALAATIAVSASAAELPRWQTTLSVDHPLTGKIWRPDQNAFVTPAEMVKDLTKSHYVFLGEKHDNPDHHQLQAWVLEEFVSQGNQPAIVWEMITEDKQDKIDAYLAQKPKDAAGLGAAVAWDTSGWPSWSEYRPIADVALAHRLPIVAGNPSRATVRAIGRNGLTVLPSARLARLGLDTPLPESTKDTMLTIVAEAHCGLMPREALSPMVAVQRARDAILADNLIRSRKGDSAVVLIAGGGHARLDIGVPSVLAKLDPKARMASLALIEVDDAETDPARYAEKFSANALPFDFVWFTPRANDRDYCAELRKRFEGHGKKKQ
jgi:uncharacterized iron-regulated protein